MGIVYTDITLRNATDVVIARRENGKAPEIRQTTVRAVVDTGSATLVINEALRQQLGLSTGGTVYRAELADGSKRTFSCTEPIQIQWKDRSMICEAVVVPSATTVLLGAIPLEAMDLIINPAALEITGAHGDEALHKIY